MFRFIKREMLVGVDERSYTGSDQKIHKKWNCPMCDNEAIPGYIYCPKCGQHLFWGEVNILDILYYNEVHK